jgi:hypothetical protein
VQTSKGDSYATLKNNLKFTNPQLLNFIRTKVIKNYQGQDLALGVQSPEVIPK